MALLVSELCQKHARSFNFFRGGGFGFVQAPEFTPLTCAAFNIPRYVDTFEEEEPIDLAKAFQDLRQAEEEERRTAEVIKGYFKELGLDPKLWEEK